MAKVAGEGPVAAAACSVLAVSRSGGSASWRELDALAERSPIGGLLLGLASTAASEVGVGIAWA